LRVAVTKFDLRDHVNFLPPVAQRDLVAFYAQAHVFVLPCIVTTDGDRDGIPNVMAEAMACGLPVVVTQVSGIPEIVEHNVNGLIVAPRDSIALADALAELIANRTLGERLGRAARKHIEKVFDAKETHQTLKALFDIALGAVHAS
jgi:glycosyltransferase involved in cell wall biosynthesis